MEEGKGTVLDALADAAIEATAGALQAAKTGRHTEANELASFVSRLTNQMFTIEDHNMSANRSGSPMSAKTVVPVELRQSGSNF